MREELIKILIIEDEEESFEQIKDILSKYDTDLKLMSDTPIDTVAAAVHEINVVRPEIIFADIELKDGTIFEVLNQIYFKDFEIVFVTGHTTYLEKAFDYFAFNYILKPTDELKVGQVISRYLNLKERMFNLSKYNLLDNFLNKNGKLILIKTGSESVVVNIDEIVKCVADSNYTKLYMKTGKTYLASRTLKKFDNLLSHRNFFRANRSELVNVGFVKSIYKRDALILSSKEKIKISASNRDRISDFFKL